MFCFVLVSAMEWFYNKISIKYEVKSIKDMELKCISLHKKSRHDKKRKLDRRKRYAIILTIKVRWKYGN